MRKLGSILIGKIRRICRKEGFIQAIKFVRTELDLGLKEAKDIVDKHCAKEKKENVENRSKCQLCGGSITFYNMGPHCHECEELNSRIRDQFTIAEKIVKQIKKEQRAKTKRAKAT